MMKPRYPPNHELRRQRKLRGWTLEEAAEHLHREAIASGESGVGCDANSISRYERGLRVPGPRYTRLLCRLYELPADRLGLVPPIEMGPEACHRTLAYVDEPAAADRTPSCLMGSLVDLRLEILIDIGEDGWARVAHRHELLNLTSRPVNRVVRELWFEHTDGPLRLTPLEEDERRLVIQRIHDAGTFAQFACQISPAVLPGESAVVRFTCEGGRFVRPLLRQMLRRPTRHLTIGVRHRGVGHLAGCTAVDEHPDGSESSITESVTWNYDGADAIITLARDELALNEVVTVRWEVDPEPA
jgi:transcriptional regulator with XRE-family HTH domain